MKYLLLVGLVTLASCSSTPVNKVDELHEKIVAHMSQPKKFLGGSFDPKFEKDGLIGGEYVAVASVVNAISSNEKQLQVTAEADARSRLLNSAPTEFKKIVQRAISTSTSDNGSVDDINVTVTEVHALTGLVSNFNDVQCVNYAVPTENLGYAYSKECRAIVHVPASNLLKAYSYTLDKKYGVKEQSAIQDLLKKQLMQKMFDSKDQTATN